MTSINTGLLITGGEVTPIDIASAVAGGAGVRAWIGDAFSSCFHVPGDGGGRRLVGYCDDRYLAKPRDELPWNCYLDPLTLYKGGWPIAGPIVVLAHIMPDTVTMTQRERSAFALGPTVRADFDGSIILLPLLRFQPHYRR